MYTTVLIVRSIIYGAVNRGANLQELCESVGLTPADLHDVEQKIEGIKPIVTLWENILAQTKDEAIGIHLGISHNLSILGLLGYVIHNCPTIKDAWDVLQKHQRMLSGWVSYDCKITKDEMQLYYTVDPLWVKTSPHTAYQAGELAMGGLLNAFWVLSGKQILPRSVEVVRPRPVTASEYPRIFQCPVKFSATENKVVFQKDVADTRVVSADKSLYVTFNQLLQAKAAELIDSIAFSEQVKRVIIHDFNSVVPAVDAIASHMNMSSRSFQRRLETEGKTYREISEEMKKELTLALLKNPKYNAAEISRALGYTEPAAFRLAFKRWMDETPAQWRKRNLMKAE